MLRAHGRLLVAVARQDQIEPTRDGDASDPGFAAHYDGIRPGLATWIRRVIDANTRAHGIDPDTATWQESASPEG